MASASHPLGPQVAKTHLMSPLFAFAGGGGRLKLPMTIWVTFFPPFFFFWFSQMISSAPSADPHADDLWQCDKRCEFAAGRFAFFWKCQRDLSQTVAGKKKKISS